MLLEQQYRVMSEDSDILIKLEHQIRRAKNEAVILTKVIELLDPELFSIDEVDTMQQALEDRRESIEQYSHDLGRKETIYSSRVLKLRDLIGRRQQIIDSLQGTYELLDKFPEETEVLVDTQASLAVDLMHAEADLQK
jgi:hypothetical protein